MPTAFANGLSIYYETAGSPDDPTVLLVPGLGGQIVYWPQGLVDGLVEAGFRVVLMDNRDAGLSERLEGRKVSVARVVHAIEAGETPDVPYLLADMADDAVELLTALDIDDAHVVGVSMGGMIAQTMAARHPERVRSLTSIMSTTGSPDVGQATPEMEESLFTPPPSEREAAIQSTVDYARTAWADHFDEQRVRESAARNIDRGVYPEGTGRQLAAIFAAGDRTSEVASITVPTLVVHGEKDPLIDISGGVATAELVPDAELVVLPGAGHDLPPIHLPKLIDRLVSHFRSV
jgi:pimeloyl-ACP methyl ester carboxylesterase